MTIAAIKRAKPQSNHRHLQTTPSFLTGRMSFVSPNQQCQSTEGSQTDRNPISVLRVNNKYLHLQKLQKTVRRQHEQVLFVIVFPIFCNLLTDESHHHHNNYFRFLFRPNWPTSLELTPGRAGLPKKILCDCWCENHYRLNALPVTQPTISVRALTG